MSLDFSLHCECGNECCISNVLDLNITHNMTAMARATGLYECLWHPEKLNAKYAKDIKEVLDKGYNELRDHPKKYKKFNPSNGWGNYEDFLIFVSKVNDAVKRYPDSLIVAGV